MIIMNLENNTVMNHDGTFTEELLLLGYLPLKTLMIDYNDSKINFHESSKERNNSKFAVVYDNNGRKDAYVRYYPRLVDVVLGIISEKNKGYKHKLLCDFTVDDNKTYALDF